MNPRNPINLDDSLENISIGDLSINSEVDKIPATEGESPKPAKKQNSSSNKPFVRVEIETVNSTHPNADLIQKVIQGIAEDRVRGSQLKNVAKKDGQIKIGGRQAEHEKENKQKEKKQESIFLSKEELGAIQLLSGHRHIIRSMGITIIEPAFGVNTNALTSIRGASENEFLAAPCFMQNRELTNASQQSDFRIYSAKQLIDPNAVKNQETQALEILVRKMIMDFNSVEISIEENANGGGKKIIVRDGENTYDLAHLLANAQLALIQFTDIELDACVKYLLSSDRKGFKPTTKEMEDLPSPEDFVNPDVWRAYFKKEIDKDRKSHPDTQVDKFHLAQQLGVNIYTTDFYKSANTLCRGLIPQILEEKYYGSQKIEANPGVIKDLLIVTLAAVSGIAAHPEKIKCAVRVDKFIDQNLANKKVTTDFSEKSLFSMAQAKSSYLNANKIIEYAEIIKDKMNECSYVHLNDEPTIQNIRELLARENVQTNATYVRYKQQLFYVNNIKKLKIDGYKTELEFREIQIEKEKLKQLDETMLEMLKSKLSKRTIPEQFQNDVKQVKAFVSPNVFTKDPKSPAYDASYSIRQDVLKRILTLFETTGLTSNGKDPSVALNPSLPLASLMVHGGRIVIQVPPLVKGGPKANALFEAIFGVSPEDLDKNSPLSSRLFASHGLAVEGDEVKEVLYKTKLELKNLSDLIKIGGNVGKHFAVDLGIGHDGAKPANGNNGHLYIYWTAPTKTSPGGLMLGMETAAPGKTNPYGATHDSGAKAGAFSPTGGEKFSNEKFAEYKKAGHVLAVENGLRVNIVDNKELEQVLSKVEDNYSTITDRLDQPANIKSKVPVLNATPEVSKPDSKDNSPIDDFKGARPKAPSPLVKPFHESSAHFPHQELSHPPDHFADQTLLGGHHSGMSKANRVELPKTNLDYPRNETLNFSDSLVQSDKAKELTSILDEIIQNLITIKSDLDLIHQSLDRSILLMEKRPTATQFSNTLHQKH